MWRFYVGSTAIINDFKELKVYGKGKPFKKRLVNQNKGQKELVGAFIDGLLKNGSSPIPYEDIYAVSKATFLTLKSLQNGSIPYDVFSE